MPTPYENNWEHLSAELALLDVLLRREVLRSRAPADASPQLFKGVYLSEGEVEQLLGARPRPADSSADAARLEALDAEAAALRAEIDERARASAQGGVFLALPHLSRIFGLTPFESGAVVVCLALETELRYEKLFAFLQDDVTRKRPSVELVLRLLCDAPAERLRARASFTPQAALFRARILCDAGGTDAPQPARLLRLDARVADYLLGTGGVTPEVARCVLEAPPAEELSALRWDDELKGRLLRLLGEHLRRLSTRARRLVLHFHGPAGTGKKTLAAALCKELGVRLLVVDARRVLERGDDFDEALRAVMREAVLRPAALYLEHADDLLAGDEDKAAARREALARAVEDFSWLTFVGGLKEWGAADELGAHDFLSVELRAPDAGERLGLWRALAAADPRFAGATEWESLAARFRLTPAQIRGALAAAGNYAHLREGAGAEAAPADLYRACRAQSNQRLGALARKLALRHDWPDLILPPDARAQLGELCAQMRRRETVYGEWGFEQRLSLRRGLCALFYGPPGTGKTMAAEIIARELQLDAYKIDLSTVVSKYIGETEKNLGRIFEEAETSNAILFFDEADALFGKRSEVKDAHDRYANIETAYLLQRVEEFDGMVILATNLRENIDEAFFRRVGVAVEFPFPGEADRRRIWRRHFPEAAPVSDDVDFNFLASRLRIAGGNIKNIVVGAAFMAADGSGRIGMRHLIRAARREYEKVGRVCTESEFAPYHALLDAADEAPAAET